LQSNNFYKLMGNSLKIITKRVYDDVANNDGYRLLIDKIWPRGVKKEDAELDEWNKEIAPSNELRKWFNHDPEKFKEFKEHYKEELQQQKEELNRIKNMAKEQRVCLLFGAKDEQHNHAIVLKEMLQSL